MDDESISGFPGIQVYDRPEFQRMLRDAFGGKFDTVFTESAERLARKPEVFSDIVSDLKIDAVKVITENDLKKGQE